MVTSWRHRLSSLYGESTRRKTKKKNNSWRSFNNTWATHQNDSWNHSEFTNILPCHFIHVIINTCGACKNIVTHPIEVLPCKKVICRDCCLNLVGKKPDFIKCPVCDQNHATTCESFSQISPVVDNLLREIFVKCPKCMRPISLLEVDAECHQHNNTNSWRYYQSAPRSRTNNSWKTGC